MQFRLNQKLKVLFISLFFFFLKDLNVTKELKNVVYIGLNFYNLWKLQTKLTANQPEFLLTFLSLCALRQEKKKHCKLFHKAIYFSCCLQLSIQICIRIVKTNIYEKNQHLLYNRKSNFLVRYCDSLTLVYLIFFFFWSYTVPVPFLLNLCLYLVLSCLNWGAEI